MKYVSWLDSSCYAEDIMTEPFGLKDWLGDKAGVGKWYFISYICSYIQWVIYSSWGWPLALRCTIATACCVPHSAMAKPWPPRKILLGLCPTQPYLSGIVSAHFGDIVTTHPPLFHPLSATFVLSVTSVHDGGALSILYRSPVHHNARFWLSRCLSFSAGLCIVWRAVYDSVNSFWNYLDTIDGLERHQLSRERNHQEILI